MTDTPLVQRVRVLVDPIASDLDLDVYDIEQRGGTLRVTLDTRPGSPAGVSIDQLALATRLINRELDHNDPVPGKYTLEVTSPGVERSLRLPAHYQREIGKTIAVRLADVAAAQRRIEGVLVAADDRTATIRVTTTTKSGAEITDRVVEIAGIDRARTVFEWGPQPKPGQPGPGQTKARTRGAKQAAAKQPPATEPVAATAKKRKPASKRGGREQQQSATLPPEILPPEILPPEILPTEPIETEPETIKEPS